MASKKQLAEQVQRILSGGTPTVDREIDIRELMLNVDQVRDIRIRLEVLNDVKQGIYDIDNGYLSYHEDVAVSTDTAKNLRYITLPSSIISLPNEMGIWSISPMQNPEIGFSRVAAGSLALYRGMQAIETADQTFYWSVGSKVYFKNIDKMLGTVLLALVKSSKDVTELEDYPVPPDAEYEIIQEVLKLYGVMQEAPHDEIEDGVK